MRKPSNEVKFVKKILQVIDWILCISFAACLSIAAFDLWSMEEHTSSVMVVLAIVILAVQSKTIAYQTKTLLHLKEAFNVLEELLFLVQQVANKAEKNITNKPE